MPYKYVRDDERRRIRITIDDTSTVDDWIASVDRQLGEGAWAFAVLVDARLQSKIPSVDEVRSFLKHVRELVDLYGPRGPLAIVATGSGPIAGAQIYKAVGEKRDLEIFWDVDQAQRWLDEQLDARPTDTRD
jgi:hypothetical protein